MCCSRCGAAGPPWCDSVTLCDAVWVAVCRCSPASLNFSSAKFKMLVPSCPTWAHRRAPSPCGSAMASTAGSPPPRALTARATRRAAARLMPCARSHPASWRSAAAGVHALVPYALHEQATLGKARRREGHPSSTVALHMLCACPACCIPSALGGSCCDMYAARSTAAPRRGC